MLATSTARDWFFLDEQEQSLLAAVLHLAEHADDAVRAPLTSSLTLLTRLAEALRGSPPLASPWCSPSDPRIDSPDALAALLALVPDFDFDLHVPTKAVVGHGYLVAKINFLRCLLATAETLSASQDLREKLAAEVGQSIYSKMVEDVLLSIATDRDGPRDARVAAARFLLRMWEDRLLLEIDDVAPALEAAWEARNRVRPRLGTMLGTEEIFRMFSLARDARFLDYFSEERVPEEQTQAFEEFLFGLSCEEITQLRAVMTERGINAVSVEQARDLLGLGHERFAAEERGAQGQYSSYKERQVKARYRALTGAAGPKKTAEEYMLGAVLARSREA